MELIDTTGNVSYKKRSLVISGNEQLTVAIAGLKRILAAIPGCYRWQLDSYKVHFSVLSGNG